MDWIHCNICYLTPSENGGNHRFWFTACGHLICWNCLRSQSVESAKNVPRSCIVCRKPTQLTEVNSKMRPEVLAFFRSPKDLLAEYNARVRQVMEFQNSQLKNLMKGQAVKYAQNSKMEAQRSMERERMMSVERDNLKKELERSQERVHQLEKIVAEQEKERCLSQKGHQRNDSPAFRPPTTYPSLNGNTPLNLHSLVAPRTTSTPHNMAFGVGECTGLELPSAAIPAHNQLEHLLNTPDMNHTTFVAGCAAVPDTPALLGYDKNSSRHSMMTTPRSYF